MKQIPECFFTSYTEGIHFKKFSKFVVEIWMFAQFTTFKRHFTFHLVQSSASAQYLYTERVPHPMTSGIPEIIYKQTKTSK